MKPFKLVLLVLIAAFAGGVAGALAIFHFSNKEVPYTSIENRQKVVFAGIPSDTLNDNFNFMQTADRVVDAVVHIKVSYGPGRFSLNPLEFYYNPPTRPSGSGVLLTDDGYIATNNHVIENATRIEVTLGNNQRFFANVVGTDADTDLALLKIGVKNVPFLRYGNSDAVHPGEWVLAIGNPFNLNSTITAGIVSAKARNIGVLRDRNNLQIESFIQTDAAINPGNSGGALVNVRGELIGINTAIATSTGSYSGYSFAIPVDLVKKVMEDLRTYGKVQRGMLGIEIEDMDANLADELGLSVSQGVLVNRIHSNSAAEAVGILPNDIITGIEGMNVNSVTELQEIVARHRPGEKIKIDFLRGSETRHVSSILKNIDGETGIDHNEIKFLFDGLQIEEILSRQLREVNLEGGVRVKLINDGAWKKSGMKTGFIIGYIDKIPVGNIEEFNQILRFKRGGILVEGYYLNGEKGTYGVDLGSKNFR